MQQLDLSKPGERKKLIVAVSLGFVALVFLWWTFFGFGSKSQTPTRATTSPSAGPNDVTRQQVSQTPQTINELRTDPLTLQPIWYSPSAPAVGDAKRNIFSFYEPPPKPVQQVEAPTATPTPTPPVLLAAVSPGNVYARTGDFNLELTGDKFTPDLRVTVDGREIATRFSGPQQISATVPAAIIVNPGSREISLRSPDGKAYSNSAVLSVAQPPTPNYTYIGIIGTRRHVDTAILQDRSNREIVNVQRGDMVGGRFRITSISEKELVLVDTNLKIKHTLPFSSDSEKTYGPLQRPTPQVDSDDDEPE
jgi:hypothetical protein